MFSLFRATISLIVSNVFRTFPLVRRLTVPHKHSMDMVVKALSSFIIESNPQQRPKKQRLKEVFTIDSWELWMAFLDHFNIGPIEGFRAGRRVCRLRKDGVIATIKLSSNKNRYSNTYYITFEVFAQVIDCHIAPSKPVYKDGFVFNPNLV